MPANRNPPNDWSAWNSPAVTLPSGSQPVLPRRAMLVAASGLPAVSVQSLATCSSAGPPVSAWDAIALTVPAKPCPGAAVVQSVPFHATRPRGSVGCGLVIALANRREPDPSSKGAIARTCAFKPAPTCDHDVPSYPTTPRDRK